MRLCRLSIGSAGEAVQFVDGRSRHRIEKQANKCNKQSNEQNLEDEPLVVAPDDVAQCLERVHEPQKRIVRSAAGESSVCQLFSV